MTNSKIQKKMSLSLIWTIIFIKRRVCKIQLITNYKTLSVVGRVFKVKERTMKKIIYILAFFSSLLVNRSAFAIWPDYTPLLPMAPQLCFQCTPATISTLTTTMAAVISDTPPLPGHRPHPAGLLLPFHPSHGFPRSLLS